MSHRYKFVFIHCRKTGGSAIKVSLYRYLGPSDIGVAAWENAFEHGVRPNLRMAWWAVRPPGTLSVMRRAAVSRRLGGPFNRSVKQTSDVVLNVPEELDHHLTARVVRARFPRKWDEYVTFCFVRNPYERAVSDYLWRTKDLGGDRPTFEDFIKAMEAGEDLGGLLPAVCNNWHFYTIDDEIAVDHVLRYEDLGEEMDAITSRIGLPWDGWLPQVKTAESRVDYRDMYDEQSQQIVGELFAQEIDQFGYTF